MKIVSFNINGIRARLPRLVEYLAREAPDVVCLQELKCADDALPIGDIEATGYHAVWHGQKGFNGVAILAREAAPNLRQVGLPGDPDDSHSRYIEAEVNGVIVASIYLPNGNPIGTEKFDYKLKWFERLIAHAATLVDCGHPVAMVGDFNVVPTDFDIYNPRSWRKDALLQPESRECWRRLLEQGWTDAIRKEFPREPVFTFWDYFRQHWERNAGLRIDHLLLNRQLALALKSAGVDTWVRGLDKASDHAPAWVELDPRRLALGLE